MKNLSQDRLSDIESITGSTVNQKESAALVIELPATTIESPEDQTQYIDISKDNLDETNKHSASNGSEIDNISVNDLSYTFTSRHKADFTGLDFQIDESLVLLENVNLSEYLTKRHDENEVIEITPFKASTSSSDEVITKTPQTVSGDSLVSPTSKKDKNVSYHKFASKEFIFKSPKVTIKKRKSDPNKSFNVTSKKFRKSIVEKDKDTKKKKKYNEWKCIYCARLWSHDNEDGDETMWINCDECNLEMHIDCIPKGHLDAINFECPDSNENVNFICEICSE